MAETQDGRQTRRSGQATFSAGRIEIASAPGQGGWIAAITKW